MKVVKIDQKNWEEGLNKLFGQYRLVGPAKVGAIDRFKELEKGEMPDLRISNTRLSAKNVIYPQSQVMFDYELDEAKEDHHIMNPVATNGIPQALIGVRPCDAASFLIAKNNFDNPDYRDNYWCDSYEKTTMVGFACNTPGNTCFCTSVGIGPYSEKGLDALLVEAEDGYLLKALSEKGEKLIETAEWNLGGEPAIIDELKEKAENLISTVIETERIKKSPVKDLFEAPFWDDLAFACINCGTCTYSCPTCWCFDIQDENQGATGRRLRNWDSCMTPLFTLEGSGHNPRSLKHQRVRQRFMHKLKYYVEKYQDEIMCVGCGRCIRLCPVNIDIRKVSEKLNNYKP